MASYDVASCEDGLKTAKETFKKAAKYFGETDDEIQTNENQDPGRFLLPIVEFLRLLKLAGGERTKITDAAAAAQLILPPWPKALHWKEKRKIKEAAEEEKRKRGLKV